MELDQVIASSSRRAIEYAKSFNKNFNFSEDDINDVEEILDFYYSDLKGSFFKNLIRTMKSNKPTDHQIYTMALIWGSYVGEVFIKNNPDLKVEWSNENVFGDGNVIHLKLSEKTRAFPIDKVIKRLTNGPEDNIKSFYDIVKIKFKEGL